MLSNRAYPTRSTMIPRQTGWIARAPPFLVRSVLYWNFSPVNTLRVAPHVPPRFIGGGKRPRQYLTPAPQPVDNTTSSLPSDRKSLGGVVRLHMRDMLRRRRIVGFLMVAGLLSTMTLVAGLRPTVGFAISDSRFLAGGSEVTGQVTVFDGESVTSGHLPTRLNLQDGWRFLVGVGSRVHISQTALQLDGGSLEILAIGQNELRFQSRFLTLRDGGWNSNQAARVTSRNCIRFQRSSNIRPRQLRSYGSCVRTPISGTQRPRNRTTPLVWPSGLGPTRRPVDWLSSTPAARTTRSP